MLQVGAFGQQGLGQGGCRALEPGTVRDRPVQLGERRSGPLPRWPAAREGHRQQLGDQCGRPGPAQHHEVRTAGQQPADDEQVEPGPAEHGVLCRGQVARRRTPGPESAQVDLDAEMGERDDIARAGDRQQRPGLPERLGEPRPDRSVEHQHAAGIGAQPLQPPGHRGRPGVIQDDVGSVPQRTGCRHDAIGRFDREGRLDRVHRSRRLTGFTLPRRTCWS